MLLPVQRLKNALDSVAESNDSGENGVLIVVTDPDVHFAQKMLPPPPVDEVRRSQSRFSQSVQDVEPVVIAEETVSRPGAVFRRVGTLPARESSCARCREENSQFACARVICVDLVNCSCETGSESVQKIVRDDVGDVTVGVPPAVG